MELAAPFPARTKVVLTMRIAELQVQAEGVVRVMHPEIGMGVEFIRVAAQQREQVEKFIQTLMNLHGASPELVVAPEGMSDAEPDRLDQPVADAEDPFAWSVSQKDRIHHRKLLQRTAQAAQPSS